MSEMSELLEAATGPGWAPLTVPYSLIPAVEARYLWPGVVPLRTPVMIAGPGGTGKGMVIAAIAALVTTGQPFPDEEEGTREPGSVIIIAPEDDANEDMSFRLAAAGANLELVHDLTLLPDGSPFMVPGNLPDLRRAITEVNAAGGPEVRLVVLDPLQALAEKPLASARACRQLAGDVQAVARDTGVAMIISHHVTKSGSVAGNQELVNAMRLVWRVSVARDDPDARLMTVEKANRATAGPVRYRIEGEGGEARAVLARPEDAASVPGSRAQRLQLDMPAVLARRQAARALWEAAGLEGKKEGNGDGEPGLPVDGGLGPVPAAVGTVGAPGVGGGIPAGPAPGGQPGGNPGDSTVAADPG